ncbi:MAG TPA: hypothetical protein VE643_08760 [Nitrososphaeraceae archaeon]|nr:hypothetical protein [Nitrososphaeraceae archaeon]
MLIIGNEIIEKVVKQEWLRDTSTISKHILPRDLPTGVIRSGEVKDKLRNMFRLETE